MGRGGEGNASNAMDVTSDDASAKLKSVYTTDPEIEDKIASAVADSAAPLADVIENLLAIERVNRLAAAAPETARVCVAIVETCFAREDWDALSENVLLLSKRRAQIKLAATKMVQKAMEYLDRTPDEKTKLNLLTTLRDVTAGKIYVELEGARLTRSLAAIKEAKGDVAGAAEIMQELQVETFGAMDRREKTEFILDQIRLCVEKGDFVRAAIISKKISHRSLAAKDLSDLRLTYYSLMIRIHIHKADFAEICRAYLSRYETPTIAENEKEWPRELKLAIIFLVLSPQDPGQHDLLHRVSEYKNTKSLALYADFLRLFTTHEIIRWTVVKDRYEREFAEVISSSPELSSAEKPLDWVPAFHERVTEHNLRVVSKYFARILLSRLAELLDLSEDETEDRLTRQVADTKTLWAKIDRIGGIVSFAKPKDPNEVLNSWADSVSALLDTVEKTCHLVHKELMVHKVEL
eukprot:Plantae.Rhodophyta-Rhodochaete_pulchella.ctg10516.p1 GENE.Plantae.Rhodophyta-Rhodochaete_pulchella.ctg10516~~Plantae.Rhodophyta-Rhodochaete_pulchella.ctg10516.p1  ORF type:complete len:465 (+),score=98.69 Plantae.Rhodophyta-Rhodochaete_pulchella.ctg10516:101-1495(+)